MKESWIDKLIELLNEYEKENWRNFEVTEIWMTYRNNDLMVISKRYWFIQRLAKHFKLNISKIDARIALSDFNATDRMLMALAISEDPITLLIDCLE